MGADFTGILNGTGYVHSVTGQILGSFCSEATHNSWFVCFQFAYNDMNGYNYHHSDFLLL